MHIYHDSPQTSPKYTPVLGGWGRIFFSKSPTSDNHKEIPIPKNPLTCHYYYIPQQNFNFFGPCNFLFVHDTNFCCFNSSKQSFIEKIIKCFLGTVLIRIETTYFTFWNNQYLFFHEGLFLELHWVKKLTKKLYGPFLWMGFNCLKDRATSRRQFTFYH